MALFAIMLVGVRAAAFYIGVRIGATISKADEGSRQYAWMGFVSQAGLAITLADSLKGIFPGELGSQLYSFILAGVAVNEIIGPAMLQAALSLAGEIPGEKKSKEKKESNTDQPKDSDWYEIESSSVELIDIHHETKAALMAVTNAIQAQVTDKRRYEINDLIRRIQRKNTTSSL